MQSSRPVSLGKATVAATAAAIAVASLVAWGVTTIRRGRRRRSRAFEEARGHEENARATEELRHALLSSALDAIVAMDRDGAIIDFNRAAEATFGYAREQVIGRSLAEVIVPPSLRDAHARGLERVRRTGQTQLVGRRLELTAMRADGTEFPVEVSVVPADRRDGAPFIGFIRDLSERKAATTAQEHAGLLQAHADELTELTIRLEASYRELESFSYSVSHDLRTPLRAIAGFAGMLAEDYSDKLDEDGQGHLRRIAASVAQMSQMIDDLLRLALIGRAEPKEEDVDVTAIVAEAAEELRLAYPAREVQLRIEPALRVRGDRRLLRLAFDNLLGNAWKFTGSKPHALVEVGSTKSSGTRVCFVRDNGIGFDMRDAARLFAPFQRLPSARDVPGNGIGLATVDRIVRRHGGQIWAESELGNGATFFIALRSDHS